MLRALAPRFWGIHLVVLLAVAAAGGLGYWQYDVWQAARTAAAQNLTNDPPVPIQQALGPDAPFLGTNLGQPVTMTGTWVNASTVYVQRNGGYWVLTPLAIGPDPKAPAIYVVRGEVAHVSPAPALPTGRATVTGWLQPPEGDGTMDENPGDNVLPQVRLADLVQHVDQDLYSGYAIQKGGLAAGLSQVQPEALPGVGAFTGARNLLYAIEWWFFGAFAVFLWWRHLQDEVAAEGNQPLDNLTA